MLQSGTRLTLALALMLATACAEDTSPITRDVDTADMDDEDDAPPAGSTDDEDDDVTDEDKESPDDEDKEPTPVAPKDSGTTRPPSMLDGGAQTQKDSGVSPTPAKDGGPMVADTGTGSVTGDGGVTPPPATGKGMCCDDGNCLCHGEPPASLSSTRGPYTVQNYNLAGAGCVYYPTNGKPPYAAVAVSDGFIGTGGCGRTQTDQWGPLYASWGIVTMIVNTGSSDQPNVRGRALTRGIAAFKTENTKSGSPLMGKLAGRYGTSGFSMGGGGTSYASRDDKTLLTSVAIMPWGPVTSGITVPTLVICGSSDGTAPCGSHGTPLYNGIAASVPKMRVQVTSGHNGQPSAGSGRSGQAGLAFQKVFLDGDTRWKPLLTSVMSVASTVK